MKHINLCILILLVCFNFTTYACVRNSDDPYLQRSVRKTPAQKAKIKANRGAKTAAAAAAEAEAAAEAAAAEAEEISMEAAEEIIAEITEDADVGNETIEEEFVMPPRQTKCRAKAITPLDTEQRRTLDKHKKKIKVMENNHKVLRRMDVKKPVVRLTRQQREEVKVYLTGAFMKAESLPNIESGLNISDSELREKRSFGRGARVCEPVYSWDNVYLTLDSNGTLVQIIQLEEDEMYQWFMEETCQTLSSSVVKANCLEAERLHLAYVINLTTGDIEQTYVVVYCCVGMSVI
ncbi:uncharacterized protein LOC117119476 [Anneissia japonica]|uniref:uncharacterized protein LOC117119476 n=1 Tax=Anneissia japonica TaxID=1529436 RepID=UPI001425A710|nr:uncharacterized protein LOC117119476 [Anneissia japonica]